MTTRFTRRNVSRRTLTTTLALVLLGTAVAAAAEDASPRRLTATRNSYPHPSPDGSKVVFHSDRTGRSQIYVVDIDGGDVRQLTDLPGDSETPKWSPDGSKIVFANSVEGDSDILVMDADGANPRRVTSGPPDDSHPHWFPDGGRIVFNSSRTTPDPEAEWSRQ